MRALTHYEILNVSKNASFEEIKSSHRKLALLHHPDKQRQHKTKCIQRPQHESLDRGLGLENDPNDATNFNSSTSSKNVEKVNEKSEYVKIQEAWECLRDDEKRRDYDIQLSKSKEYRDKERIDSGMAVLVDLSEMEVEVCEVELDPEEEDNDDGYTRLMEQNVYIYNCRCGDCFEILESDFRYLSHDLSSRKEKERQLFECQSCSLTIAVYDDVH